MRVALSLVVTFLSLATLAGAAPPIFDVPLPDLAKAETAVSADVPRDETEATDPDSRLSGAPVVGATEIVRQLTGAASHNDTAARWNVHGTDLGHMFRHDGALYMVFGDTYGADGGDWRSNTMARIDDPDPAGGLPFAAMIKGATGTAKELVRSAKIPGHEWTVIPTNGISVAGRMVLHYMSVRFWGADDQWFVRRSGLAFSDDHGQSWTKSDRAIWAAGLGFEQVAYAEHDGMIYVFGIPQGRYGAVRLGRVAPEGLLDPAAYSYWDGAAWSADIARAATVVPAPAGELSVAWSETHGRWLMLYFEPARAEIVLRTAPAPTGPWSAAQRVVSSADYPGLYAPYIVPTDDIGDALYFTMSLWKPIYNVFLMKTTLEGGAGVMATNEVPTEGLLPATE
ncbi:hypothetical protein ROJ8625_03327 [Roseivivax jejudonensis]|uniref:DUF4185 domain-containing protein n=1 Tax=Roseivivax jejudonensis TaxID=1529041 RepID=A0A1X6ZYC9_9RHOB|nr:DUF4185 domain-containing protein [Roseivivax jejudonensis]SLN65251.1 hypothetical protein ROJ8625_03327 [Roseivivax jejudonensis]